MNVMASGGLPWASEDSLHCWNALWAWWSEKAFANCLKHRGITIDSTGVEEVESVDLRWDAAQSKFSPRTEEKPLPGK